MIQLFRWFGSLAAVNLIAAALLPNGPCVRCVCLRSLLCARYFEINPLSANDASFTYQTTTELKHMPSSDQYSADIHIGVLRPFVGS